MIVLLEIFKFLRDLSGLITIPSISLSEKSMFDPEPIKCVSIL